MDIYSLTSEWSKDIGLALYAFPEISSTNDLAKTEAFKQNEQVSLYLTKHQSGGRGRFERTWVDEGQGQYLLCSFSLSLSKAPHPVTTARIGLALVEAFSTAFPNQPWSLKAPNDILLRGKKIAGILTEAISQGAKHRLIVGLGVNVFASPDIENASNLQKEGLKISRDEWLLFLENVYRRLSDVASSSHINQLETSDQVKILNWLNENPNLKEQYSSVEKDGGLEYDGQKISWEDI